MAGKSLNKVQLIGHTGTDPELRSTSSGQMVATFNLATNESKKKGDGYEEFTEWHRIVAWGRTAEVAAEYATKGKQIYLEGRLQTRSWDDQNGVKRYTTEVVAQELILLGGRGESSGGGRPPHPADDAPVYTGKPQAAPAKTMQDIDRDLDRMGAGDVAKQFGGTVQPPEDIPF